MRTRRTTASVAAIAALALWAQPQAAAAETTLSFVTNWAKTVYSPARTLEWMEKFNASDAAKAADIRIEYVGGPEATPAIEQLTAVRNGVFDMMFGAAGYYVGQVPEGFALYGTQITPMQARANGGIDLLAEIYREKANAHVLGWVAAGIGYHVWLKDEPKLKADGTPDLSGLKIRSSPLYRGWLEGMDATQVMVPAPDIYTAMERGTVDGAAWPGLGVTDFGWEKFVKYRIDPAVWQFDNLIWVNLDKWSSLTAAQQDALTASVIEFEREAHGYYAGLADAERKQTIAAGVQPFMLEDAAAKMLIKDSEALQWAQIEKKNSAYYDRLREKFPPTQ